MQKSCPEGFLEASNVSYSYQYRTNPFNTSLDESSPPAPVLDDNHPNSYTSYRNNAPFGIVHLIYGILPLQLPGAREERLGAVVERVSAIGREGRRRRHRLECCGGIIECCDFQVITDSYLVPKYYRLTVDTRLARVYSMFPLLKKDEQVLQYTVLTLLWNYVVGYNPFRITHRPLRYLSKVSSVHRTFTECRTDHLP